MFSNWLFTLPPLIVVLLFIAIKWLLGRYKATESALELHITGTSYFTPLPIIRPELSELLTLTLLLSCLFLCISLSCHIIVEFKLRRKKKLFEVLGLITGGCTFMAGFLTSVILL